MAGKRGRRKVKATTSIPNTARLNTRAVTNVAVEALEAVEMSVPLPGLQLGLSTDKPKVGATYIAIEVDREGRELERGGKKHTKQWSSKNASHHAPTRVDRIWLA